VEVLCGGKGIIGGCSEWPVVVRVDTAFDPHGALHLVCRDYGHPMSRVVYRAEEVF
jgi:hypothetical protein